MAFKNPDNTEKAIKEVIDVIVETTNIEKRYIQQKKNSFFDLDSYIADFMKTYSDLKQENAYSQMERERLQYLNDLGGRLQRTVNSTVNQLLSLNSFREKEKEIIPFSESFEDLLVLATEHFCVFSINPTINGNSYTGACISVLTDEIILSNRCKREEDYCTPFKVNFGTFFVHFIYDKDQDGFLVVEAINRRESKKSEEYTHPNICNDELCLGDSYAEVNNFIQTGQFLNAFDIINGVLHEYGITSCYALLESWLEDYKCCRDCGESSIDSDKEFYECCEEDWCEDCVYHCTECGIVTCNRCTGTCRDCGNYICEEHRITCQKCHDHDCPSCIKTCENCGSYYCEHCIETCPDCEDDICSECLEEHREKEHDKEEKEEKDND